MTRSRRLFFLATIFGFSVAWWLVTSSPTEAEFNFPVRVPRLSSDRNADGTTITDNWVEGQRSVQIGGQIAGLPTQINGQLQGQITGMGGLTIGG
jgi:hypothetical protein